MNDNSNSNDNVSVPFKVHESTVARWQQSVKTMAIALAVVSISSVIVIAFVSFLNYKKDLEWNKTVRDLNQQILDVMKSYDYETEEIIVDGKDSGTAKYIGDGSRNYEGDVYGTDYNSQDAQDAEIG